MIQILNDIATCVRPTRRVRQARKDGEVAVLSIRKPVPVIHGISVMWTMEASVTYGKAIYPTFRAVFNALPEDQKHALCFTPEKSGEWLDRARFWRDTLKPQMSRRDYHVTMIVLLDHYRRCIQRRAGRGYGQ